MVDGCSSLAFQLVALLPFWKGVLAYSPSERVCMLMVGAVATGSPLGVTRVPPQKSEDTPGEFKKVLWFSGGKCTFQATRQTLNSQRLTS